MPSPRRRQEVGRGERVLPGVWRLRLPLPWPGVPHGNAWALAAGDGVVLVDCGLNEPGSLGHLERAMDQVGLRLEHVRLLVCTHAHGDHYGQAAAVIERSGCELWMHPRHEHARAAFEDPERAMAQRLEIARQAGVPLEPLARWAQERKGMRPGIERLVEPDRDLVPGVVVESDLGPLSVHETFGHAPSHVSLFEPSRRMLISGDHLLGRVSLFFEHGFSPDPVGEFLTGLDTVEALDARLCLPGHGRTFTDVAEHIAANRALVAERLAEIRGALAEAPHTVYELAGRLYGEALSPATAPWLLTKALCYAEHLQALGDAARDGGEPERWSPAA